MSHTIHPQVIWHDVDGELVLFHVEKGRYYGLDAIGAEIFRRLGEGQAEPVIVAALTRGYDVDEARATAEVARLIDELRRARLLD